MPHVDEGTLHALLDGALKAEDPARAATVEAHLEVCPDCRALLDDAAAIRDGATGILAALETDARPDFQEVLTRAGLVAGADRAAGAGGGTGAAPSATAGHGRRFRGQARATRAVAWAATIVLALGTGYLVRDRLGPDAPAMDRPTALAERTTDRADGGDPDRRAPEPTSAPESDATRAAEAAREPSPPAAVRPSGEGERAAVSPPRAATSEVAGAQATDAARPRVAGEPEAPAGVAAEPELSTTVAAAPTRREAGDRARAPAVTVPGERALALRGGATPPRFSDGVALEDVVVTGGRRGLTADEARELMDGPVFVLPGAEVVRIEAGGDGTRAEIRSVQRMEGGPELTVTQRRVDAAPRPATGREPAADHTDPDIAADLDVAASPGAEPAAADTTAAASAVQVLRDGYALTITGTLPPEAMRALAEAARPLAEERDAPHPQR